MPRKRRLSPIRPWTELATTRADWQGADPALLAAMLAELHLIRAFEETVLELAAEGLVHGSAHSSIGQEGGAVGSVVGLRASDAINGSHRSHHQFLAKAISYITGSSFKLDDVATPVLVVMPRILGQDPLEVPFAVDQQVVQALAPQRPHMPLRKGIRPGRPGPAS